MKLCEIFSLTRYDQKMYIYVTNAYDQNVCLGRGTRYDIIKNYKNVRLGLDVNGEIDSVKYPVDGIFNMDAMYDGYLDTWNIATRSEEERIEEFLEENDALLKNRDKIPFKYISDIHYGKKTVWKNPDFEN